MTKTLMFVALMLIGSIVRAQAPRPGARMALNACKPDIQRFCSKVAPGEGRVKACMKEHLHELSEPCKEALFQAWLRE